MRTDALRRWPRHLPRIGGSQAAEAPKSPKPSRPRGSLHDLAYANALSTIVSKNFKRLVSLGAKRNSVSRLQLGAILGAGGFFSLVGMLKLENEIKRQRSQTKLDKRVATILLPRSVRELNALMAIYDGDVDAVKHAVEIDGLSASTKLSLELRLLPKTLRDAIKERAGDMSQVAPILLHACARNRTEAAMFLIDRGANPGEVGPNGMFPVHLAAKFGNPLLLDYLLRRGASPDPKVDGLTQTHVSPLTMAMYYGNAECVRLLLGAGASPNISIDDDMNTPFHRCAGRLPKWRRVQNCR